MGSAAWRTSAIATADSANAALGLSENVSHEAFVSPNGGFGESNYAAPTALPAIVTRQQGRRPKPGGQDIAYRVIVAFTRPVRIEPRDRITLWDGTGGPIVDIERGPDDPATGIPCAATVFLGFGG